MNVKEKKNFESYWITTREYYYGCVWFVQYITIHFRIMRKYIGQRLYLVADL